MSAFHYILSSLPFLSGPKMPPPLADSELLDLCGRFLNPRDYELVASSNLSPLETTVGGMAGEYRLWESSLCSELEKLRLVKRGLNADSAKHKTDSAGGTHQIAVEAMEISSPLEAELFLVNQRWLKADELSWGHYFDLEALCAYRLKLLLLERRALFNKEKGSTAYQNIYTRVLEASGEMK
ncbi:MAG: hypothetical protein B0D92_06430 [Spirochaeta sp. LUC14_002_19_P3]|nr:MAG: hypothetical protein B0D92_06430 [Spirochaeta sp. LUC14_002_19_P3]